MATGAVGRVGGGIEETLNEAGLRRIGAEEYLNASTEGVYCLLSPLDYLKRKDGRIGSEAELFADPAEYECLFRPFARSSRMLVAGHYWDPRQGPYFRPEDVRDVDAFSPQVVSDVSCDLPGALPTTLRACEAKAPFYDVDRKTLRELPPSRNPATITVTAVDNLPSSLPRESSAAFGESLASRLVPYLLGRSVSNGVPDDGRIKNATLCEQGFLTARYSYLEDYASSRD